MASRAFEIAAKAIADGKIENEYQLDSRMEWVKDESEQLELRRLFAEKTAAARSAVPFDPTIQNMDVQALGATPFEENNDVIDDFSPAYWFQYFWSEIRKEKLGSDESGALVQSIAALFNKEQDTTSRGFKFTLKDSLAYTKGAPASATAAPTFAMSSDAAGIWKEALYGLMCLGFRKAHADKLPNSTKPLENGLLEKKFVEFVKDEAGQLKVFWRGDGRPKSALEQTGGAKRTIDSAGASAKYALDQAWHPYSDDRVKNYMWFRRANADNDFYTVVSITTDIKTACTFPLVDERRAYKMPLKDPSEWSDLELTKHRTNLAEVSVNGKTELMLATVTYVYMLGFNGGVVMDTRNAGAHYRGEDKGFPENGVKGYSWECFMGHVPVVRVHHGPTNAAGFTTFDHPSETYELYLSLPERSHRFGLKGASLVFNSFMDDGIYGLRGLSVAWSSYGATAPGVKVKIDRLVSFPASEQRVQTYIAERT